MRRLILLFGGFVTLSSFARPVVVFSIDGLKPDYVREADKHRLKIPNLRRLLKEGTFAEAVVGVMPTLTYPSHTTIVTGVSPSKHGIFFNVPFDPFGKSAGAWYWFAEDIKVPTLWDAAAAANLETASVDWPVTIGANITYRIPQFWSAGAAIPEDHKLSRALSTPGLLDELEPVLGKYPAGYNYTAADDAKRVSFSIELMKRKKPALLLGYISSLDEEQHARGPNHPEVFAVLEKIDAMIGDLWAAVEKSYDGKAVFVVLSDHGFSRVEKKVHLNVALREAGLIQVDKKGQLTDWKAFAWNADGSTLVVMKDPKDETAVGKVRAVLQKLAKQPSNGILKFMEGPTATALGGFPAARFVVAAKPGYAFAKGFAPSLPLVKTVPVCGDHGFIPETAEMDAALFIAGSEIARGKSLGGIDMRAIAPTLARLLKVELPTAELPPLSVTTK